MKIQNWFKLLLTSWLIFQSIIVNSQTSNFPPALGPSFGSGTVVFPIYTSIVHNMLDGYLRDSILPAMNDRVKSKSIVPISISHRTKQLMPYMSQTTYNDKPNERVAIIPYEISFKLNITGFPDRYLKQNISVKAYCRNWASSGGGNIRVTAVAEKAQLVGESLSEKIIDAFTLENLSAYINNIINDNLPGIIVKRLLDVDIKCNCINLDSGASPTYEGTIKYYYKTPPTYSVQNGYRVSIKKIKKLNPTTLQGKPLFDITENFPFTYYINQKRENTNISGIQPGQERSFPENDFFISKSLENEMIVVIAAIDRAGGDTDAGHLVLNHSNNFGVGINKILIQRSYRTEPFKLENGTTVKGAELKANAYEVTVEVKRINQSQSGVGQH